MSDRARALADAFEQANGELVRLIEGLSDAQWTTLTDAEQWTVGATAHHISWGHAFIGERVKAVAESLPLPQMPPGGIDAHNAVTAEQAMHQSRDVILADVRTNAADAAALVRGLSDEQLDRTFSRPNGETMTLVSLIQNALLGHMATHSASIRAAVGL